MAFDIISTETWRIALPTGWIESHNAAGGGFYFESPDERKGVYVATWNVSNQQGTSAEKVRSIFSTELKALHDMEGKNWTIFREWSHERQGCAFAGFDAYDVSSSYRILSQLIGRDEWVVRSGFHDYDCTDYNSSKDFFEPIVSSLEIHK